jgi:hypothetical protein
LPEYVLAKLQNPEPTMPQWKVTLATTKKIIEKRKGKGHSMTLPAASVFKYLIKNDIYIYKYSSYVKFAKFFENM